MASNGWQAVPAGRPPPRRPPSSSPPCTAPGTRGLHSSTQPFRSHLPVSPCLIDWGDLMQPTYPTKCAYVEPSSGRVYAPAGHTHRPSRHTLGSWHPGAHAGPDSGTRAGRGGGGGGGGGGAGARSSVPPSVSPLLTPLPPPSPPLPPPPPPLPRPPPPPCASTPVASASSKVTGSALKYAKPNPFAKSVTPLLQGLTLVHVRAQLEQLQDIFMS